MVGARICRHVRPFDPERFMSKVSMGWVVGVAVMLTATLAFAQRGRGPVPARQGWLSDYAQARDLARQTGKPMMLVFRCVP
jgi:hypothetical protein